MNTIAEAEVSTIVAVLERIEQALKTTAVPLALCCVQYRHRSHPRAEMPAAVRDHHDEAKEVPRHADVEAPLVRVA